jgi:hypothetical protein
MTDWKLVEGALHEARGIAFDTCHKIYVLMDDAQMAQMRVAGYDPLLSADDLTPHEMLSTIQKWYAASCDLRFVQAVRTVAGDPNEGFDTLIAQGESSDEDDEHEAA